MPAWAMRFVREEDGTVTILAFFIFVTFLMMGGIGIDTMRQEMMRAKLQATLDGAVLAGATAPTAVEARLVVEDYFAKSGMSEFLDA
ncbi:MAG: Tad domain-containing protein, partial [Roseovarius sp.]|nr:Tad domain-containing protein [Roseovarius sp.]